MSTLPKCFEIETARLPIVKKGVDPNFVSTFLEEARTEYGRLAQHCAALEAKVAQYENERSAVNNAFIAAQKSSDDLLQKACAEADALIEEAKSKAGQMDAENRSALRELQSDLEDMALSKQRFADDFRALLRGYIAELDARFPVSQVRRPENFEVPSLESLGGGASPTEVPEPTYSEPTLRLAEQTAPEEQESGQPAEAPADSTATMPAPNEPPTWGRHVAES